MNAHGWFNACEAVFWLGIGIAVAVRARGLGVGMRRLGWVAATSFILFGVTDIIEISTGAWYEPTALRWFNAVCITGLAGSLVTYVVLRRREKRASSGSLRRAEVEGAVNGEVSDEDG